MKTKSLKRVLLAVIISLSLFSLVSCLKQAMPLDRIPETIVWQDSTLLDAYITDVYANMYFLFNQEGVAPGDGFSIYGSNFFPSLTDEAHTPFSWLFLWYYFKSGKITKNDVEYYATGTPFARWPLYTDIRKMNVFLQEVKTSTLPEQTTNLRIARVRFARAYTYFELARDHGGVPLITTPQSVNDVSDSLFPARNKEIEIYDFALAELNDIIVSNALPAVKYDGGNPTLYAALALKSQIALYAANLAKWGSVELNGIVGVPADRAEGLYQASYDASKKIMDDGVFSLFNQLPGNKTENFRQLFLTRQNQEVIYAKEFNGSVKGVGHSYDVFEFPYGLQGGWPGNGTNPYLEMAEEFEFTDGTPGEPGLLDRAAIQQGLWTYSDLWKNKDPRFFATLYTHGTSFQNNVLQMNQDIIDGGGNNVQTPGANYSAGMNTGFGVLKHLDDTKIKPNGGESTSDWIIFRLGAVLLDHAEAAFELSHPDESLVAVNDIRTRAGLQPLSGITRENIRHERKVELAFENGDRYYSLKAWRESASLLSKQYSGLQYTTDVATGKFKITVLANIDGANPPVFTDRNYYIPIGVGRVANNANLVENPNY